MKYQVCLSLLLFAELLLPLPSGATTQSELRQLEKTALQNNLDLRAAAYTTRASESMVSKEYGIYDPQVRIVLGEAREKSPDNELLFTRDSRTGTRRLDFSLARKLPSGAELIVSFENLRQDSESEPFTNPAYDSGLSFSLVQPLLKGFGRTVTEQEILLASHDREIAIEDLREQAVDILAAVRNAYFDVLRFRDELSFLDSSISLAEKILEESRTKVDAGVFPPIEILEAEVGLIRREQEQLDTSRAYQDALDVLTLLLGPNEKFSLTDEVLQQAELMVDEENGYRLALQQRPDLLRRLSEIEKTRLNTKLARNAMLPQLNLSGTYGRLGHDRNYTDSFDGLTRNDFHNWGIALTLSYPLGNREAHQEYQRIHYQLKSQQARLAQLHEETRKEIRNAIRLIEMSDKRVDMTGKGRFLAEKKMGNLLERHKVGLATTREVLEGEEDLARARSDQIVSLVVYNNALTEYLRVTGQLLDHESIRLVGTSEPELDFPSFIMTDK